jgi:predicted RND superfamily exporter protein
MKLNKLTKLYKIGIQYPKVVLSLSVFFTLLSLIVAKNLKIEVDLSALAHQKSESLKSLNYYKKYFGGMSYLLVTIESEDPDLAGQFAADFAKRVEQYPAVDYVDYPHTIDYFKKRFWLYVDLSDLKEMEHRLDRAFELEKRGISSVFNHLMDFAEEENRPDLRFEDIFKKYENKSWNVLKRDPESKMTVLRIKVKEAASEMNQARVLIQKIQDIEQDLKRNPEYSPLVIGYTGPLKTTLEEADQIAHDMFWVSGSVALILILIIGLYFRRIGPLFLIGIPLGAGMIWSGGAIELTLGHLNLMTSFAGGILAGLGSDYGIYLLARYYSERRAGKSFHEACFLTFEKTGSATYASMITTVGAFVALMFSRFAVFFELGLLGALGILLNYIAMVIVLPSLLVYADRWKRWKESPELARQKGLFWTQGIFLKAPILGVVIAAFICGIASMSIPASSKVYFQEDMMVNKKLPGNRLYDKMSESVSSSLSPTILMIHGFDEEAKAFHQLETLLDTNFQRPQVYKDLIGLSSFIPQQQEEKKQLLATIKEKLERLHLVLRSGKDKLLSSLKDSLDSEAITRSQLPEEVTRLFNASHDKDLFAVYLFPAFSRLSSEGLRRYHEGISALKNYTQLPFDAVDGTFVYDDIVRLIEEEAPRGMILIWIFLIAVLYVIYRSPKRVLITIANLLGSLILLSGVLWLLHIRLNVMNIATIPIILGTGIDSFIHFAQRYDESQEMTVALKEKIPAIIVSNLTTIIGFAGLVLASNPGLRSVGWVAVLGLTIVTTVCVLVFPRCLILESKF